MRNTLLASVGLAIALAASPAYAQHHHDHHSSGGDHHGGSHHGGSHNAGHDRGHGGWNNHDNHNDRHGHRGHHNNGWNGHGGRHHDWRSYHRSWTAPHRHHWGRYHRPHGWYYRNWAVGAFLPSLFFAERYWINSYYDLGLPPPPPGARWVRYGDDALLIDDFTGEIIQVVRNVFY
ncbi:MAG: RcnB family protein [Proteobacteria bacterium]|nr:RcnB family protein [Pseudomonadota bacterium]